ncbi:MAG TPA: T9SS type A sorting domain-containing protein [bacterium]|nr:T9SS type A sorting domain-containing protein [bacterium]HPR88719.1 T9SS type A sorting domain-containing protein [bacterium]
MKQVLSERRGWLILVLTLGCLLATFSPSEAVVVRMRVNTCTNLDTLSTNDVVQLRGEVSGTIQPTVTWTETTGITMKNIGGDYWEATFQMSAGSTLKYKFWTGFSKTTGTSFWSGWEGPIIPKDAVSSNDNRYFVCGARDTTVELQYYHSTATKQNQYWRPYAVKQDTLAVRFRVNVGALLETGDFNPASGHTVVVRGSAPLDPTDSWNTEFPLTREAGSADKEAFFSGTGYIAKSALTVGSWQNFKYVIKKGSTAVWESTPNRYFQYKTANDTTIHWAYFNNTRPSGGNIVTATLTWQMKTDALEKLGLFSRSLGEKIVIDGAKAWDIENPIEMNYVPLLSAWVGQESFTKAPGAALEYKAVLFWDDSRLDPASPNYMPGLDLTSPIHFWEEPNTAGTGNRNYTFGSTVEQFIPGDYGFDCQFFGGLPVEGVITTPITITFSVDMTPATSVETNPANTLFRPGIDTVWVQLYGAIMSLTQGQGLYTNTPLLLSDPDGDLVYTGSWALKTPTVYDVAYRINYSAEGGAVIQNGGGFTSGRSYVQFIHPDKVNADGSILWPAEFAFPKVAWSNGSLPVEIGPNLWTPSGVATRPEMHPAQFALLQNYPNPFNPETAIGYQLPAKSRVGIRIYNLQGELVSSLLDKEESAGAHAIIWYGRDSHGRSLPSGVYFARMNAGDWTRTIKMTLMR